MRNNQGHQWTDEENDYLRREYKLTKKSVKEIALHLGLTAATVHIQLGRMGLHKRTLRNRWTPEQDEQLRKLNEEYSVTTMARKLHRSPGSITNRIKRLKISRRSRSGWFTKREVCEILGMDHHWVQARIDSGELIASYHNGHRPTKIGSSMWHISEHDLKHFICRFPEDLNGRNVDMVMIVDILAGVEYG